MRDKYDTRMTRAQKSKETREKIIKAGLQLLREQGYEELTIRNICEVAGVSNGSFYHFYQSKDDLLAEYLDLNNWRDELHPDENDLVETIISGYLRLIDLYEELGIEFVANYYNANNQAFNVYTRKPGKYISSYYTPILMKARENGDVREDVSIERIVLDIQAIVIGNVFQWCVVKGVSDIRSDLRRMLTNYMSFYVLSDSYREKAEQETKSD